ncbi:hypothetical protein CCY99_03490 [Helicobacter sp. 16-1353]|uniref:phosphoadenosine phosphosulfate reductase domain-containing protein n=1 Tax=Helicobacter sp. 16-1353 TaxID=2004996 RepID=UPI000DCE33CC|nr:phosphoadenosine phosphosulfate reductase family protein [Helicobacter sp. 16-1353]RAX54426.1 hypothetical protein CCY99_03490 [Helicobacter sp. 16-1353]
MTISKISGGRDSTAMTLRYLELGNDIDFIIFCDTGWEFPLMYEYIDKVDSYLQKRFNKKIIRLDESKTIEKWAFELPITEGKYQGHTRGVPRLNGIDYCTRETKIHSTERFLKENLHSLEKFRNEMLIGYTYNEVARGRKTNARYGISVYPLFEWKWNEPEVNEYLNSIALNNPLYRHFNRTGCFICPKQSKTSLYNLWKHYPKEWQRAKDFEARCVKENCVLQKFKYTKSLEQIEAEFKELDSTPKLFECEDADLNEVCYLCR